MIHWFKMFCIFRSRLYPRKSETNHTNQPVKSTRYLFFVEESNFNLSGSGKRSMAYRIVVRGSCFPHCSRKLRNTATSLLPTSRSIHPHALCINDSGSSFNVRQNDSISSKRSFLIKCKFLFLMVSLVKYFHLL